MSRPVEDHYVLNERVKFVDMITCPEILRAIIDCGYEHPSEVQRRCIPQAVLGMDIICQAKSGMGKTTAFVLSTLQQLQADDGKISVLVMCHTRGLAFQISKEYRRLSGGLSPSPKIRIFSEGNQIEENEETLKNKTPHIAIGTPGRVLALVQSHALNLKNIKFFILDECDKMLGEEKMHRDIQKIFEQLPAEKQVLTFSNTLTKEFRIICKRFMHSPLEVFVDTDAKLTLRGLQHYFIELKPSEKIHILEKYIGSLKFNQIVIFVKTAQSCNALNSLLTEQAFPSTAIHRQMSQDDRLSRYQQFKNFEKRILVATDLFDLPTSTERVNIVFNYDMPENSDTYLHRVALADRFGTKGLAISFVSDGEDAGVLNGVQDRFDLAIPPLRKALSDEAADHLNGRKDINLVQRTKQGLSKKFDFGSKALSYKL